MREPVRDFFIDCSPSEFDSAGDQSVSVPGDALHPGPGTFTVTILDGNLVGGGMSSAGVKELRTADESHEWDPCPRSGVRDIRPGPGDSREAALSA